MPVNGTAVAVASIGGLLLYAAVKNTSISDTAKSLLQGQPVASAPAGHSGAAALGDVLLNPVTGVPTPSVTGSVPTIIGGVGGGSGNDSTAARAMQWAEGQVGKPYKWGAIGPDAFDCSGLVYAAYRAVGVSVPRLTTGSILISSKFLTMPKDPAGDGRHQLCGVDWSLLLPGDLIFPDPGHVVFLVDPSSHEILEAPHTGANVRLTNYSEFRTVFAIRRYRGY